jgi:hypothetical protein
MRHCVERRELTWQGLKLYRGKRCMAEVVPDNAHSDMWRVRVGDELSDLVNLSRAKDAACCRVLGILNAGRSMPPGRPTGGDRGSVLTPANTELPAVVEPAVTTAASLPEPARAS